MPTMAIIDLHGGAPNDGVPTLAAHVTAAGASCEVFDGIGGRLPRPKLFDAYLLSGGSTDPTAATPWRVRLSAAVPEWARHRPVFGVGVGFQIIAGAHGWPVRPLDGHRRGRFPLTPTPAGWDDPLTTGIGKDTEVIEDRAWGVLAPPASTQTRAVVLAYSAAGDVAIGRFNKRVAGVVYHPDSADKSGGVEVLSRFLAACVSS